MSTYFVTGIGTDVGKTICSAVLVEALKADYWKPVQAGGLDALDSSKVKSLISNNETVIHAERYLLTEPMSPHAAAEIDGVEMNLGDFQIPETKKNLIIEGAGGLMVPLNLKGDLVIDLIKHLNVDVILVSQNYLGSINHTLLSVEALKNRSIPIKGILFNGVENKATQEVILKLSGLKNLGRLAHAENLTTVFVSEQATLIKPNL